MVTLSMASRQTYTEQPPLTSDQAVPLFMSHAARQPMATASSVGVRSMGRPISSSNASTAGSSMASAVSASAVRRIVPRRRARAAVHSNRAVLPSS